MEHSTGCIKILTNAPGFYYSLNYFNCEHFAAFCKFEQFSESSQMNSIEGFLTGGLTRLGGTSSREALFNKLAYMQWWENVHKSSKKEFPRRIIEEGINEWERE